MVHWFVLTGAGARQLIVHSVVPLATVVEAVAELSATRNSVVALETLAVLEIIVPFDVPAFSWNAKEKTTVSFGGRFAMVQLIVPLPAPTEGVTQVKAGPEFCTSETKVVPAGTESIKVTL